MSNNWVGKTLGKVQIESLLARGGMAEVYLGTHTTLDRKVAVKILRNPGEEASEALERFQREARVIASLRHPNIVQVHDFDTVDGDPYLVMEYIDGPSLSMYLHHLHKNEKTMKLPDVVRMLGSVASALQYAHNNKIVHRDIKPGNILLTSLSGKIELDEPLPDDFVPVLTDFGLVRFLDSARQTTTGITAGTPAYMSPEQAQGETTDGLTDVYSLGIVLYEMLAGKLPFDGETTIGILLKHVNEPPAPIPGLSPFMQNVLNKALAKKPKDRFQSPAEFAKAFAAAVDINPFTMQMEALSSYGPQTLEMEDLSETETLGNQDQPKQSKWMRFAIAGGSALLVGAFLFFNGFPLSESKTETGTPSPLSPTTAITSTFISTKTLVPVNLQTTLVLHFRDENAVADQAYLEVERVPAPPGENNYEVWLFNDRDRISLGILSLNTAGKGELVFTDDQGENLVAQYDQAEITLEPLDDTNPLPTKQVAYSFALPEDGTANIRHLLSSFPNAPDKSALIQGLYINIQKINELAGVMDTAYANGDETLTRQSAETIMNLVVGAQSLDYKDWDGDGVVADDSDGYGLLLNGSNLGYFGAVYTEADNAVNSSNASKPALTNGEYLKTSVQNLATWTSQLQEIITAILESPPGMDIKEQIVDAVIIANQMLNGFDMNDNGNIEPELGEGGVESAYLYAYAMADMPLASTGLVPGIGTSIPISGTGDPSNGGNGGGISAPTQAAPTQHIPPGQVKTDKPKNPSNTPKPKKNDNGKKNNN